MSYLTIIVWSMKNFRLDSNTRIQKYQKSYSDIWDEIEELLTDYANVIEDMSGSDGILLEENEVSAIYDHFKNKYRNV